MGKYSNTQCADIKYGIAFGATTDLILLSKAIQPTWITHGLNIIFYTVHFLNPLLTRISHQHWIGIEKTVKCQLTLLFINALIKI